MGRIFERLQELGLDRNTYVLFASDNGPWASREAHYRNTHGGQLATGSAKPLRSSKGSPYEGGFRVPAIFWAPGKVPAGIVKDGIISTLDILPTFAAMAGAEIPNDRIMDGVDQSDFLTEPTAASNREVFYYYIGNELQAVRQGNWKVLLPRPTLGFPYVNDPYRYEPELYDLETDISEKNNLADEYPETVDRLLDLAANNTIDPASDNVIFATPR